MSDPKLAKVTFTDPVTIGGKDLKEVSVRTPAAGELRGCNVTSLLQMNVDQHLQLLPRITQPPMSAAEIEAAPPSVLMSLMYEVLRFLKGDED